MKRRLLQTVSVFALILMLAAPIALAQYSEVANALVGKIPFSFHIGQSILPAGEYIIKPVTTNSTNRYIRIRSVDSPHMVMLLTIPLGAKSSAKDAKLVFNRYGSNYFLSKISSPADGINEMLFQGKAEKEMSAANTGNEAKTIQIALVRH